MYDCAICGRHACTDEEATDFPSGCPTVETDGRSAADAYQGEDLLLARSAAQVEAHGYCRKTRLEETMDFARRCGFTRLGLAFCIGLRREAAVLRRILVANGFTVDSVLCKNGRLDKSLIGIGAQDRIRPDPFEAMCNPIGQARALERAGTELNIVLGLCVGHDSLFFRHSSAPVTVLAAKDRVLGHNPMAALYLADGYYHDKLFPAAEEAAGADAHADTGPQDDAPHESDAAPA